MAKSKARSRSKKGKSLGPDIEEEAVPNAPPKDNEEEQSDDDDKSLEMNDGKQSKTPMKRIKGKIPKPPKFTPKKKVSYHIEDSSSDEEEDDATSKTSDDDTSESGGDKDDPSDDEDSDSEDAPQILNPGEAWQYFVAICNLNDENILALNSLGYHNTNDIELFGGSESNENSSLTTAGIPHATVIKINIFATFLFLRGDFDRCGDLRSMAVHNRKASKAKATQSSDEDDGGTKGMLKLGSNIVIPPYTNEQEFTGFWENAEGTFNQTSYGRHLLKPPKSKKGEQANENKALHYILQVAFKNSDAEHVVSSSMKKHGPSGFHTARAINAYYRSTDRIAEVRRQLRDKISQLNFSEEEDSAVSIQAYTNDFRILTAKLKVNKEKWSNTKKKQEYLRNIQLPGEHPIQILKVTLGTDEDITYAMLLNRMVAMGNQEDSTNDAKQKARARRTNDHSKKESNSDGTVPPIPDHVVKAMRDSSGTQAVGILFKWKNIKNKEHRDIRPDELHVSKSSKDSNPSKKKDHSKSGKRGGSDKDNRKGKTPKRRRLALGSNGDAHSKSRRASTKTRKTVAGVPQSTAVVSIKDPNDRKETVWTDSSSGDESDREEITAGNNDNDASTKTTSKTKGKRNHIRRVPMARKVNASKEVPGPHRLIWDSGSDVEVIGGTGWHVTKHWHHKMALDGALVGMETVQNLPMVAAVTATDTPTGTHLLGIGVAAIDERPEQVESLVNPNVIVYHVDDRCKERGGAETLELKIRMSDDPSMGTIPIILEAGRLPLSYCRCPTTEELQSKKIYWLVPCSPVQFKEAASRIDRSRITKIHYDGDNGKIYPEHSILQPETEPNNTVRRNPILDKGPTASLAERLANCPEELANRTLQATTQLRDGNIDMDNREIPRMNRKKRGVPFAQRRLEGRTDSDTFFSSVKSIRGYRCVQLFVHLLTQFLWIANLRREKDNHGAYQDFIREVGTPNILLTDNAKSQVGKKWTETSRKNKTQQIQSAPYKQNQNQSERKVGDVERRVEYTLFASQAPIVFWCYCIQFVVYCLNLTARRRLNYRTPAEALTGLTPDISHLKFAFWQKAWYYEFNHKFPESPWKPCRVIMFADHQGDQFTYKIWTVDENEEWKDGKELTRDIVIPRVSSHAPPSTSLLNLADYDALQFESLSKRQDRKTTKMTGKRSRKRAAERASKPGPTQRKQRKAANWEAKLNDELTLCTADLTETESDYDDALDPTEHLIRQLPSGDHDSDNVPVSIVTGGVEEDVAYILDDSDVLEFEEDYPTRTREIYNEFDPDKDKLNESMLNIESHRWQDGQLQFKISWDTGEHTWETFPDMKEDHPRATADYMVRNNVTRKKSRDPDLTWAKHTARDIRRTIRRNLKLYDFQLDQGDRIYRVRRKIRGSKKKKNIDYSKKTFKYGLEVPRTVARAMEIDKDREDTKWSDSIGLEVDGLIDIECFEFKPAGTPPPDDEYQDTKLHWIFAVKHDLRRKARLVAGGHLIDAPTDLQIYSSQVKPISIKLIGVIADKLGLKQLCGDVSNAYVNAKTSHKVYVKKAGPEFGSRAGQMIIIRKALYGLSASGADWHRHFSSTLRSIGFSPTRFDRDVWIKLADTGDHYEYICTYVDNFLIASKKPDVIMDLIKKEYHIKGEGPPDYYLGNDYKIHNGRYAVGCKKYIKEAVSRVEQREKSRLKKHSVPSSPGNHPELDTSEFLNDEGHLYYQMLVGMLNWIVGIGRFDIAHATSSLARFSSCPRKGHLERALRVFGYLKKYPNKRIVLDSRDPIITGGDMESSSRLVEDFKKEYPEAVEEIDSRIPLPLVDELAITVFVDSDHAHDKVTRRSITGLIILVGRTPVFYYSKRQGAVETSTYSAEFMAMRHAVEEVGSIRYMLRCLGVHVDVPSKVFGDNLGVIQNATIKDSLLKKKHVAISYHKVREAVAAGIIVPIKIASADNFSDCLTKALPIADHFRLVNSLFYG